MSLQIDSLDHLVFTVVDIEASLDFFTRVLDMEAVAFAGGRKALAFGSQKINLHQAGREFEPRSAKPTPGFADLCLLTTLPLDQVQAHLSAHAVPVIEGPIRRTGATGPILSLYFRDPDGNLIEVANRLEK